MSFILQTCPSSVHNHHSHRHYGSQRWAKCVARKERANINTKLRLGNYSGQFGRPRQLQRIRLKCTFADSLLTLKRIKWVQVKVQFRDFMNMIMNLRVSKTGTLMPSEVSANYSRLCKMELIT